MTLAEPQSERRNLQRVKMIAITVATYPLKAAKEVIQLFTSAAVPARLESAKELALMTCSDEAGQHVYFIIEIPDSDVGAYLISQGKRSRSVVAGPALPARAGDLAPLMPESSGAWPFTPFFPPSYEECL